jgi:hypothetical protein
VANDQVFGGTVEPQGLGEEPLYYFTRVFLLFLQGLFEQFPSGSYKWSVDEKVTEIEITDQVPIPRSRIEQKPQIVTMRGPAQFANMTLDQMRSLDPRTGTKERTDLVSCTMTINAIARNGVEAQRIAWIAARHIRTFKAVIQRTGRMHKVGDEIMIGPESPPGAFVDGESDPEWILITVQCPFYFQWTEKDSPLDALLLRGIQARLQSALLPAAATTTAGSIQAREQLRTPTIRGRPIQTVDVNQQRVGIITQTVKT